MGSTKERFLALLGMTALGNFFRRLRGLHFFRRFDSEQFERGDELEFDQAAELQQECLLVRVLFGEDAMPVVEKVERLRELERVLREEGGFLRAHGGFDLGAERSCEQHQFPKRIAVRPAE